MIAIVLGAGDCSSGETDKIPAFSECICKLVHAVARGLHAAQHKIVNFLKT